VLLPAPLAQDEALRALAEIREVAERTARYSTFSALSGFIAGAAAIAGSGVCGAYPQFAGAQPAQGWHFVAVWGAVLAVSAAALAILTKLKARRRGEPVWTPIARTAFLALLGPGAAGVAGSIVLSLAGEFALLAGLWLLLYGCGLWAVSFFAPLFLRVLGVAFVALGVWAWIRPDCAALWLGLGFGCLHVIFGAVVMARYHK
jgi:hypothetical protein